MAPWPPPPRTVFPPAQRMPVPRPPPLGVTPLRPPTGREIAAGGWRVRRRHSSALVVAGAVVEAVLHAVALLVWPVLGSAPGVHVGLAGTVLLLSSGRFFLLGLVSAVVDRAVDGRPAASSDEWRVVGPVRWRLVGLSACCGVAVPVAASAVSVLHVDRRFAEQAGLPTPTSVQVGRQPEDLEQPRVEEARDVRDALG
jgi:hypothetical protein